MWMSSQVEEGGHGALLITQSPMNLLDAFDCVRGMLIAGIVAPLEPSLCRRTAYLRQDPHLVYWTVEPVRSGAWLVGHDGPK
jgi:hypothetical protein